MAPNGLPELIPYGNGVLDENSNKHIGDAHLVDARRDREKHEDIVSRSDRVRFTLILIAFPASSADRFILLLFFELIFISTAITASFRPESFGQYYYIP